MSFESKTFPNVNKVLYRVFEYTINAAYDGSKYFCKLYAHKQEISQTFAILRKRLQQ